MTEGIARFESRYPRLAALWGRIKLTRYEQWWVGIVRVGAAAAPLIGRMDRWYQQRFREAPLVTGEDYNRYLEARVAEQEQLFC